MDVFASKLRERAAGLGISNAGAARRSGPSERRYAHYVSGLREPDLGTPVRIARSLGTPPDVLPGVADARACDGRQATVDRIGPAMGNLPDDILDLIAIQVEALGAAQARKT